VIARARDDGRLLCPPHPHRNRSPARLAPPPRQDFRCYRRADDRAPLDRVGQIQSPWVFCERTGSFHRTCAGIAATRFLLVGVSLIRRPAPIDTPELAGG
jgi:hypothetical protein